MTLSEYNPNQSCVWWEHVVNRHHAELYSSTCVNSDFFGSTTNYSSHLRPFLTELCIFTAVSSPSSLNLCCFTVALNRGRRITHLFHSSKYLWRQSKSVCSPNCTSKKKTNRNNRVCREECGVTPALSYMQFKWFPLKWKSDKSTSNSFNTLCSSLRSHTQENSCGTQHMIKRKPLLWLNIVFTALHQRKILCFVTNATWICKNISFSINLYD